MRGIIHQSTKKLKEHLYKVRWQYWVKLKHKIFHHVNDLAYLDRVIEVHLTSFMTVDAVSTKKLLRLKNELVLHSNRGLGPLIFLEKCSN